jgi:hypothetical protein
VALRGPASQEGAARPAPDFTKVLATLARTVTLALCGAFCHGSQKYHADQEQSRALGVRAVVVGGRMTMGYVGELLDAALGERWARSGRRLVKFTTVRWPAEPIRVTAGIGRPDADDPSRDTVRARVEKRDGTVVLVAEGSVARM